MFDVLVIGFDGHVARQNLADSCGQRWNSKSVVAVRMASSVAGHSTIMLRCQKSGMHILR